MSEESQSEQHQKDKNLRGESSNQEITYPVSAMLLVGVLGIGFYIGAKECSASFSVCLDHHDN